MYNRPMQLPAPGQIFQRKYKLQEVLGRGGFAAVYRATDIEIGRDVAIKVLAPAEEGYTESIASRFMREARVIAGLQDPHTITMFDFGRSEDGLHYMVFEYVRGIDLSQLLKRRTTLEEEHVIHVLEQVLQSLREAHSVGVLHRDIKPANILVYNYMGDSHRVKLLDFGIAKPVAGGGEVNITREGALVGTPRYMAPEQIYGGDLTPASDLYSLGLVAHEMLVGQPAIAGQNSKETIRAQLSDVPVIVPRTVHASEGLCGIIDRMTARDPARRFQSADEVLRALEYVEPDETAKMAEPPVPVPELSATQPPTVVERPPPVASPTTVDEQPRQDGLSTAAVVLGGVAFGVIFVALAGALIGLLDEKVPPVDSPDDELRRPLRTVEPVALDQPPVEPEPNLDDDPEPPKISGLAAPADAGTAADAAAPAEPQNRCGEKPPWRGDKQLYLDRGLNRRFYFAYLPEPYDQKKPVPVVLMFHKLMKSGSDFLQGSDIRRIADRENVVVLSFDAADNTAGWDDYDIEFVKDALDETAKALCLDRSRVYAIGDGGGGLMARNLACEMPLSAIAMSGSGEHVDESFCTPDPPVPTMRIQGLEDRYIPIQGGRGCLGGLFIPLKDVEEAWRKRNECSGKRRRYTRKKDGTCFTWSCEGAPFVSCHIEGGHDWSTAGPEPFEVPGCSSPMSRFPHIDVIWSFFEKEGRKR